MTRVVYADGPSAARVSPATSLAAAGMSSDVIDVALGWTLERHAWLDDPGLTGVTFLGGYGLAGAIADGRLVPLPVRLSAVPSILESNPPDLGVIAAVRRGDGFAFSGSVGWGDVLGRVADRIVVEIDEHGVDLGGPEVGGDIVASLVRPADDHTVSTRHADDLDLQIGAYVASLVPDDATLQFGPGGVGEGIARALDRPVRIWSGLCTDAIASLHDRSLLAAPVVAAYTQGGAPIRRLADAGMLELTSTTVTHDLTRLSAIPRFVGCNTALQVGLDGAVNLERVDGRMIAAIGGHSDFCAGASRSVGGVSIIAVRSTTRHGASTIVPRVEVVSTQRSDVDVVITEQGIADLRGVGDHERAERLIAIANPDHRASLRA